MSGFGQVFYWIKPDGNLQWARHDGTSDGTLVWTGVGSEFTGPDDGLNVGSGWNVYSSVFWGGAQGIIYAITPDGDMHWYSHDGFKDGTATWTAGDGGRLVGSGWNTYAQVFAGGRRTVAGESNGFVIYGITPEGELDWYRHEGWTDGSPTWTGGDGGRRVGSGWNTYPRVFSVGRGIIYGITADGEMDWFRHDGWTNGSPTWTGGDGGRRVGSGWNAYSRVFGSYDAGGQIYGFEKPSGTLGEGPVGDGDGTAGDNPVPHDTIFEDVEWYRHDGWQNGNPTWTAGDGGRVVLCCLSRVPVFPGAMVALP
ncbi:tachylectin-related carbohydrate-binding protein [Nocardia sp. NPDC060259]|uniref:tachylectin-related carbohydrate-binding protein n=1 Tax=Nocardia sp. NPDC060259 TaxID=3347088 RepID=UPI003662FEC6